VSKRRSYRAFVGLSGPIGYDFFNTTDKTDERDISAPNPLLEDVTGLLVCYDELVFLSRQLCPADLRGLPYVHFVSDRQDLIAVAAAARDECLELIADEGGVEHVRGERFEPTIAAMTAGASTEFRVDNHTHYFFAGEDFEAVANAASVENVLVDISIAAALGAGTDVVTNSMASAALTETVMDLGGIRDFEDWQIDTAQAVATVMMPNRLGPTGAYHESLEDLRAHRNVIEFREMLREQEPSDPQQLADEVSALAWRHAREQLDRFVIGRSKFATVGSAGVGLIGNAVQPGFGSAAKGLLGGLRSAREWRRRKEIAWASFVLAASVPDCGRR
jgi:hypothetical protein